MWGKSGREIVYLAPNYRLTKVTLDYVEGALRPVNSRELFAVQGGLPGGEDGSEPWWDMTSDGNFFIIESQPNPITVVDNWPALTL